jgi:hypothetical protein
VMCVWGLNVWCVWGGEREGKRGEERVKGECVCVWGDGECVRVGDSRTSPSSR